METFLLFLAAGTLLLYIAISLEVTIGNRSIAFLKNVPPLAGDFPRVSIVIPARNEERNLEEALRSILAQDYPNVEIVVVDDRSTDRTGEILDRMAAADPRLKVVHVTELPPGWLGKNHALELGSEGASGDFLLFTDADVVMEPTAVRRAVAHMEAKTLDHITISPEILRTGLLYEMFIGTFALFFALYLKPWKAGDPRSSEHVGIGAFNLVRTAAYRAVGGHRPIALRPDDDLKLGKLFKKNGRRQEFVYARDLIQVQWYDTVGELIHGLEKNSFAGLEYRVGAVVASVTAVVVLHLWPWVAVFVTHGPTRWLNAAVVAMILLLCWWNAPLAGVRRWLGIFYPVATALFAYIIVRSTVLTLRQGGVRWRGTLYPLAALKANKV